jgi:hypothetical protein
VPFRVDTEVFLADGLRWVAVFPEIDSGAFTVTIGRTQASFTIDPSLARRDLALGDELAVGESVQFERMAIDRADTLTIEARAPRGTIMYFVNHSVPEEDPYRRVWIGPGHAAGGSTRFELPLARLGVSCSDSRSIALSLYSSGIDRITTLYPPADIAVDRGRVQLPVELLPGDASKRWLPCPGASVRAEQDPPEALEALAPSEDRPAPHAPPSAVAASAPDSGSTSWSPWWLGALAVAAALCVVALLRRSTTHSPS